MSGVGSEIERLLPRAFKRPGCGCEQFARMLDVTPPFGIEVLRPSIVARLTGEARQLWYLRWLGPLVLHCLASMLVAYAIWKNGGRTDDTIPRERMENGRRSTFNLVAPPTKFTHKLRKRRDIAVVTIGAGRYGNELLEYTAPRMERYAADVGADFVSIEDDQCPQYGIGNKWRLREIGKVYDRVLFFDADVWLEESLPNLFRLDPSRIWTHWDRNELGSLAFAYSDIAAIKGTQGLEFNLEQPLICNTGVVLFSKQHAPAWQRPMRDFVPSHTFEQQLFEVRATIAGMQFGYLPRRYNLQFWMQDHWGEPAHVRHLASCPHRERINWLASRVRAEGGEVPIRRRPESCLSPCPNC